MASVAIPMVAGFAAQKLATDVLGVDPKIAAILGMAAGGGAGAWASGGGSFGSLFGNTAGSAAAGQGASTIGQNMFGQTAGMAGMSPKVGGGLLSAAGTTGGAVPASLGYNAHAAGQHGMDMFASSVNPHAGLAPNAFTQNPYVPIDAGGFTGGAVNPSTFTGFNQPMSAAYNSPQTFTGVNDPSVIADMGTDMGNGYAGTPYTPMQLGGVTGSADAPARLAQYSNVDLMGGQGAIGYTPERVDLSAMRARAAGQEQIYQNALNDVNLAAEGNSYWDMANAPIGEFDQVSQPGTASNVGADRMGQTSYAYPNNSNGYNTSNISNSGRSMYNRSGYPVDPALRRNYGVPKYGQERWGESDLNYQVDEDMYTAQLFRDGNTVSGNSVADSTSWNMADDLDYAELGGGGDSISKDIEYQKWLNDKTLEEQGLSYADMAATNPMNWTPATPEYDAYARATHGMDGYAMNEYDMMAREPIANFDQVDQAIANTRPNPYNPGPAEATGTPPIDNQKVIEQSDKIQKEVEKLAEGKPSWWDNAENQQFLMQAASILLSDDIEEQQVSSGGGGGGGPPSPGVYSGGASPAPKVVFGMGPYNGQGQQGYNPREIM